MRGLKSTIPVQRMRVKHLLRCEQKKQDGRTLREELLNLYYIINDMLIYVGNVRISANL